MKWLANFSDLHTTLTQDTMLLLYISGMPEILMRTQIIVSETVPWAHHDKRKLRRELRKA